jgi:hypothetical protein
MRTVYVLFVFVCITFSCHRECEEIKPISNQFVFGRASEFCNPGDCEKLFVVDDGKLFEGEAEFNLNKNAAWAVKPGDQLSWEKYGVVYSLESQIPESLLASSKTLLGCEDCIDWSGVYISTFHDGQRKFWYITSGYQDPAITPFIQLVYSKIAELE